MKLLILFSCLFISLPVFTQRVYPYQFNDKYGLVDEYNNKVTEPVYDVLQLFPNQKLNHFTKFGQKDVNGKMRFGLINNKGNVTVPADFEDLTYDGNGLYYFIRSSDTILITKLSDNKVIAKAQPWTIQSYNSLVIYDDRYTDKKTVLFTDGTQKIIPPSYRPDYTVVDEKKPCPVFIYKNEIYDCSGKTITYDVMAETIEGIDESLVEEYPGQQNTAPKTIELAIADKFIGARKLAPILDKYGNVEAITVIYQYACALANPEGEIIYKADQCSFMDVWKNKFGDDVTYVEFGISGHRGLLTLDGKELLDDIFMDITVIDKWHYEYFNPNIESLPQLFEVYHKSGYRGYADRTGKVFLPKECNCIR